jgi:hypothetical protein
LPLRWRISPARTKQSHGFDNAAALCPTTLSSSHRATTGSFTRDGVTVEINICRLEDTKWALEVVQSDGTSTCWDGEFETDDEAYAELMSTIEKDGMLEFRPTPSTAVN